MATLLIKGMKEPLKERLKKQAEIHHRSMNQEALHLIEQGLEGRGVPVLKRYFPVDPPLTPEQIYKFIREGRK